MNPDLSALLTHEEFVSLLDCAKGLMHRTIPAEHKDRLILCFLGERPGLCKIRSRAAHCARASALAVDMDLPIHPTDDPRRDL